MSRITFNKSLAKALFLEEARKAERGNIDTEWEQKVERLSQLCEEGVSKTHIAFLGTVMLAKALDHRVDLFAIKPEHAKQNDNSFSARTLCHSVIVPLAAELGIHIGVTGREPLNNQPYFRMRRLNDGTPVHAGGQTAFKFMLTLVTELNQSPTTDIAREALRAYIAVRRTYQPRYTVASGGITSDAKRLAKCIVALLHGGSENGRLAQAAVAGLLDVFAGVDRVECGRINDPSRKYPGDVCVRAASDPNTWERAFEVRDKKVTEEDIQIFGKKCVDMNVRQVGFVMASEGQSQLNEEALQSWARGFGIGLSLFFGWRDLIDQTLFWAAPPTPEGVAQAVNCIEKRLIAIEASPAAVALWQTLVRANP